MSLTSRIVDFAREEAERARTDGWFSSISGLGLASRDRGAPGRMDFCRSSWLTNEPEILSSLFHFDWLSRKIVSVFPDEALRRPMKIECDDTSRADAIEKEFRRLRIADVMSDGATWGRLFGGGIAILGVADGKDPREPLEIGKKPMRIHTIDVFDKRRAWWDPTFRYERPQDMLYGQSQMLRITPIYGGQFHVHRSRCLVFGGARTAAQEKEEMAGWDASVLQAPWDALRQFEGGFLALHNMIQDASTGVFKIKGLLDAIANKDREQMSLRAQILDAWRGVTRSLLLDADAGEEFSKIATSFSGVAETMDRASRLVASAADIPVTVLGLDVVSGLGANGENDLRSWYDRVESYRTNHLVQHYETLIEIVAPGSEATPTWDRLWQPTDKEEAETEKLRAEKRVLYIQNEVYTPEEVALSDDREHVEIDRRARTILPTEKAFLPATTQAPGGPPGTTLATPPSAAQDDDDEVRIDEDAVALAAGMTEHGVDACEHGRKNRCPLCGVERVRGITGLDPNGQPVWRVEWRAIS